ncbi:MAG TPA: tyrosine-protein phosphatase [Pyrinomonadaceae bacterium]|nr:tyrosine-protein phosphatase [Pyrinomonadaceae bacterium]
MTFIRKSPAFVATLALISVLSIQAFAKSNNSSFPNIKISNFGQMDDNFFRGARPSQKDLAGLAALGIKTVIDLTDNSLEKEKPAVEAAGMHYVNIPIVDKKDPSAAQIAEFLKITNDPATGKFYVHCAGGRHRTGVMAAMYRFNHDHWNYDQVYAEMKQFDFYTSNGHGGQLEFVQNYWQQFQAKTTTPAAAASAGRR